LSSHKSRTRGCRCRRRPRETAESKFPAAPGEYFKGGIDRVEFLKIDAEITTSRIGLILRVAPRIIMLEFGTNFAGQTSTPEWVAGADER
jgi:hypothetical protein